jgi:hypothetical protein
MTAALYILARGVDDLFELVPIILVAAIAIVVSIIKKVAARKAEEAQRQHRQRPPEASAQGVRQVTHPRSGQTHRPPQHSRPQPGRTAGPAGPPTPPPIEPEVELAQQALRAMGLIPAEPQPSGAEQLVVLTPAEPASVRVEEELEVQRRRQSKLKAQRHKRLAAPKVPEADSAVIKGRTLQVRPSQEPAVTAWTGPSVDLSSPEKARRAIIFHEIFSAPKALRQGKEMWDV